MTSFTLTEKFYFFLEGIKHLRMKLCQHPQNLEEPLLRPQETQSVDTFKDNFLEFQALPQCWLYVDKSSGLEFMRMDPITKQINRTTCSS